MLYKNCRLLIRCTELT